MEMGSSDAQRKPMRQWVWATSGEILTGYKKEVLTVRGVTPSLAFPLESVVPGEVMESPSLQNVVGWGPEEPPVKVVLFWSLSERQRLFPT